MYVFETTFGLLLIKCIDFQNVIRLSYNHVTGLTINKFNNLNQMKKIIPLEEGDFYLSEEGYKVFTKQYHLKRGYCCESGCRHCPYGYDVKRNQQ